MTELDAEGRKLGPTLTITAEVVAEWNGSLERAVRNRVHRRNFEMGVGDRVYQHPGDRAGLLAFFDLENWPACQVDELWGHRPFAAIDGKACASSGMSYVVDNDSMFEDATQTRYVLCQKHFERLVQSDDIA